jgi:benzylsuccinate CoA-transferase BbsF subunit/naphthyl-2-methylsuccinate CoA transferase subunit
MAQLLAAPELPSDPLYVSAGERMLRWQEFDALAEPYLSTHTAIEIVMTAQALRMPFAFVPNAEDLLQDEHLAERQFFTSIEHPGDGSFVHPGAPFKMRETPLQPGASPQLGEATAEVLTSAAGYETSDLTFLSDQGVI